ncbi:MAG: hypothetical protein AB1529_01810 [Candidatus Micrarchaeota archaeon]
MQAIQPVPAKKRGWPFRPKEPLIEQKPRLCDVVFDTDFRIHAAAREEHRGVVSLFNRWMGIEAGTFSRERELALMRIFYGDDERERPIGLCKTLCPHFGARIDMGGYDGRLRGIMKHTLMIHLNQSGVDHFGIPIFDLELLRLEGYDGALRDIRDSVTRAVSGNRLDLSDTRAAYYIFQGYRILRYMERLLPEGTEWEGLSRRFPQVPVPGCLNPGTDLSPPERLEAGAFSRHAGSIINSGRIAES